MSLVREATCSSDRYQRRGGAPTTPRKSAHRLHDAGESWQQSSLTGLDFVGNFHVVVLSATVSLRVAAPPLLSPPAPTHFTVRICPSTTATAMVIFITTISGAADRGSSHSPRSVRSASVQETFALLSCCVASTVACAALALNNGMASLLSPCCVDERLLKLSSFSLEPKTAIMASFSREAARYPVCVPQLHQVNSNITASLGVSHGLRSAWIRCFARTAVTMTLLGNLCPWDPELS